MASLFAALAFLTRIPVRDVTRTSEAIGRSTSAFPVVGAILGSLNLPVLWMLRPVVPPALTATMIVLTSILLTGALHWDGLADMADGFGGGRTREDVLRIMRDHHIGTYGALALVVVLLLQINAIATLVERGMGGRWLVIAPTASRWSMVLLGRWLPYARSQGGLGRAITDHVRNRDVAVATLLVVTVVTIVNGWSGAASLLISVVLTVAVGLGCQRRIDGITGDTLGANAVLCETTILIAAVAFR